METTSAATPPRSSNWPRRQAGGRAGKGLRTLSQPGRGRLDAISLGHSCNNLRQRCLVRDALDRPWLQDRCRSRPLPPLPRREDQLRPLLGPLQEGARACTGTTVCSRSPSLGPLSLGRGDSGPPARCSGRREAPRPLLAGEGALGRQLQRDEKLRGKPFPGRTGRRFTRPCPRAPVSPRRRHNLRPRGGAARCKNSLLRKEAEAGPRRCGRGRVLGARELRVRRGGCPPRWSCGHGRRRTPSWTSASRRCGARTRRSSGATRRSRRTGARPSGRASR